MHIYIYIREETRRLSKERNSSSCFFFDLIKFRITILLAVIVAESYFGQQLRFANQIMSQTLPHALSTSLRPLSALNFKQLYFINRSCSKEDYF